MTYSASYDAAATKANRWTANSSHSGDLLSAGRSLILTETVRFSTNDGYELEGTLVANRENCGPLVLINSATAVPRGYYLKFAKAAVEAGAFAALIYDYRGVAGSQPSADWNRRINMKDWGILDMPAAIRFLDSLAPGRAMVGVGHSIGGTSLGLCGNSDRFSRFVMIAAALGTLSMTDEHLKLHLKMNYIARPIARLLGKAPRWLGIGESLPSSVLDDWARWCGQPNYLFDDVGLQESARFSDVTTAILSVAMEDDKWATIRGVRALESRFTAARFERRKINPKSIGADRIGHLGFFRSRHAAHLWPSILDWLIDPPKGNAFSGSG